MKIGKGELKIGRFVVPYRVYGETGRFIVCVNGAQQTMAAWKTVVSYFSKDYRIVLFDFPNQGRGKVLSGPTAISFEEQLQVLQQVVRAQNSPEKLHVVGASWGGIVVAVFASQHQELVEKIILASFSPKTSTRMLAILQEGKRLYETGQRDQVSNLIIDNFGKHLSEAYKEKIRSQFDSIKKEQLQSFYEHGRLLEDGHSIVEVMEPANIKAKTLIINGEHDTIMNFEDLDLLANRIPNCETKVVQGVGHFLHNEREDILGIYSKFLAS